MKRLTEAQRNTLVTMTDEARGHLEPKAMDLVLAALTTWPSSWRRLRLLGQTLMAHGMECDDTLIKTMEFVRANRLPKQKTLKWLDGHGLTSDRKILAKLWIPLSMELTAFAARKAI